ncbi:hypothetical protein Pcinc_003346 [Petrolisthes cinctipes]|uniref:tRNA pseudouridine(55) synthase n=1 Tax=Petrolisthes cinctipes TaxID=88211 RepID=A0AAE1GNR0_PETCI|nr:hypothetical protein Pcinc_003346 [Petrolisthes cinctipes]
MRALKIRIGEHMGTPLYQIYGVSGVDELYHEGTTHTQATNVNIFTPRRRKFQVWGITMDIPSYKDGWTDRTVGHQARPDAGRYNKYSRELPQTPWFVEGERKQSTSVQELLSAILNNTIKAQDLKFSSSGREDVDVRCLGVGRPFVIEFINPRHTLLTQTQVAVLQSAVNESTHLVKLRHLQIVDKKDVKYLKEGEEEKTKTYCALCLSTQGYNTAALDKLNELSEVSVEQKTPLRVLHRRPLATRTRIVHTITAVPIDLHYFKLYLTTQAGTYIKEFIHGDLGRTNPNLRQVIGVDLDIMALDVENVALDWPPKCSE